MPKTSIAAGIMAVCLAGPAFAQNSMSSGAAMSSSGATAMTCDQMIAQEQSMSTNATGARMVMAQKHMHLAQAAKQKGDEAGCKMHVQKAMDSMK